MHRFSKKTTTKKTHLLFILVLVVSKLRRTKYGDTGFYTNWLHLRRLETPLENPSLCNLLKKVPLSTKAIQHVVMPVCLFSGFLFVTICKSTREGLITNNPKVYLDTPNRQLSHQVIRDDFNWILKTGAKNEPYSSHTIYFN